MAFAASFYVLHPVLPSAWLPEARLFVVVTVRGVLAFLLDGLLDGSSQWPAMLTWVRKNEAKETKWINSVSLIRLV